MHYPHVARDRLICEEQALEETQQACDVVCQDDWLRFHLEEIKAIIGHVGLEVIAHVNGFQDLLYSVELENAVRLALLILVPCFLGEDRLLLDHIHEERLYILLEWYFIVAMVLR